MPYIKKLPKKNYVSEKQKWRNKLYNYKPYRDARDWWIKENCWCKECLKEGKLTPTSDLHHILSPFDDGLSGWERYNRLMDEDNWMPLCKMHHAKIHNDRQKKK